MKAMEPDRIRDVSHEFGLSPDSSTEPEAMVSRRIMRNARAGGEQVEAAQGGSGFADAINVGLIQRAAEGSGQSLPDDLRGKFEQSLGTDLGGVRVHTHSAAAEASESLGARAYAVGQDVFMGAGQYNPSSPEGASLLAHEVAHTVQQRGAASGPQTKLEVSSPGDAHEVDADRAADAMVRGEKTSVMTSTGISRKIQRDITDRHGHGHGHGHGATAPTTTTPAAAPTTTTPTAAAPTAAAPAERDPRELESILAFIPNTWQNICDKQMLAVRQLSEEIDTPNEPSMAETIIAGMVNAAIGGAVGQIAEFIASLAGPALQRLIAAAGPAAAAAAGATTTGAPAATAAGTAPATGAATPTTGASIATWVTTKIADRIKSDLETSASALAGNQAGHTPSQQFVNAQLEALTNAKESAQLEFMDHVGRFRSSPHGFEEAQALRDTNAEIARTRAIPAQHAASLAEWARTGQGRSAGVLNILDEINHGNFGETSLVVNVDMPEPRSNVSVQSSRWPALNDATRRALRERHASMRIEEFNPAMRIRIYQRHWVPFLGEEYFDLVKIPGQSNVQFERTGTPLLFLFHRQNPDGNPQTTPLDVQLSAAQVAAQMIWLGIWHSPISRLGDIGS